MEKFLTEQEVLKRLHVKDFRHMTKSKVMAAFASMLPNMTPEVAMKILDQFPSFAEAILGLASQYKDALIKAIDSGTLSTNQSLVICQSIIDGLREQLDKGDLTFEEKRFYIEKMQYVAECVKEITFEHHSFILKCVGYGCLGFLFGGATLLCVLGGNINFNIPNKY